MRTPLADQIRAVEDEITMRRGCYPGWIEQGRLSPAKADKKLTEMEDVLTTVRAVHSLAVWLTEDPHPEEVMLTLTQWLKQCPPPPQRELFT